MRMGSERGRRKVEGREEKEKDEVEEERVRE